MITSLTSTDLDPALSPLQQEVTQAPRALDPRTLPGDEQPLLRATLEALDDREGAPDAIVAGVKEELAELRATRAA